MSPATVATRPLRSDRATPVPPLPPIELLLGPLKEIVVDWQLPTDADRRTTTVT